MTKNILNISQNIFDEVGIGMVENFLKNIFIFFIGLISFLFFEYLSIKYISENIIGTISLIFCVIISLFILSKSLASILETIKAYKILYAFNKNLDAFNLNEIINARKNIKEIGIEEIYPIKWVDFALEHICIGNKGIFIIFKTKDNYKVFALANVLDYVAKGTNDYKFYGEYLPGGYKFCGEYLTIVKAKEEVKNYLQDVFDDYKENLNENN